MSTERPVETSPSSPSLFERVSQQLQLISKKSGIPYPIVLAGLGCAVFFVFIGFFARLITNVVGMLFPALCSIRALESNDENDDKQWLTYWAVYGVFHIVDLFTDFILSYIPFYFLIKILFLIWLFLPSFQGASVVYNRFLIGYFNQLETKMNENFGDKSKSS